MMGARRRVLCYLVNLFFQNAPSVALDSAYRMFDQIRAVSHHNTKTVKRPQCANARVIYLILGAWIHLSICTYIVRSIYFNIYIVWYCARTAVPIKIVSVAVSMRASAAV